MVSHLALMAGLRGHFELMAEIRRVGLKEAIEGPLRRLH